MVNECMIRFIIVFTAKLVTPKLDATLKFAKRPLQKMFRFLKEDKKSEESKAEKNKKFLELRGKGDFHHNIKVLKTGGELVVWRRPGEHDIVSVKDYVPCKFCLSFLMKVDMWKHVQSCLLRKEEYNEKDLVIEARLILYPNQFSSGASRELKELILMSMLKDKIIEVVHSDDLITTYGSYMLNSSRIKRANEISQRMRILSRLLIKLREHIGNPELTLTDVIDAEHFNNIVTCTQVLGGFKLQNNNGENVASFKTLSLPLKVGYSLEKCAVLLKGTAIKLKDSSLKEKVSDFLEVFNIFSNIDQSIRENQIFFKFFISVFYKIKESSFSSSTSFPKFSSASFIQVFGGKCQQDSLLIYLNKNLEPLKN